MIIPRCCRVEMIGVAYVRQVIVCLVIRLSEIKSVGVRNIIHLERGSDEKPFPHQGTNYHPAFFNSRICVNRLSGPTW